MRWCLLALLFVACDVDYKYVDPCLEKGGHWLHKGTTGIGFTTGGNIAVTPSSIRICISEDGRILE